MAQHIRFLSAGFAALLITLNASAADQLPTYLEERSQDYPGCAETVYRQLQNIPVDQQEDVMQHLFEACQIGRAIGEERALEMYGIPAEQKPKKKTGFKIEVVPPRSLNADPYQIEY